MQELGVRTKHKSDIRKVTSENQAEDFVTDE